MVPQLPEQHSAPDEHAPNNATPVHPVGVALGEACTPPPLLLTDTPLVLPAEAPLVLLADTPLVLLAEGA